MAVGIACPKCRYLIGVAKPNVEIVSPVAGDVAGVGVLLAEAICPDCRTIYTPGFRVEVILPEFVDGGKRRVNVRE